MKLRSSLMNDLTWDAILSPAPADSSSGRSVIVLDNEEILTPEDADFGGFSIVGATDWEREALRHAGYSLSDWVPDQGPEGPVLAQPEGPQI